MEAMFFSVALAALPLFPGMTDERKPLPEGLRVDRVLVDKSDRRLYLLKDTRVLKSYRISLGANPTGHKQQEGDMRTPEGEYMIDYRNPKSQFHLSLHISYPNARDRQRARRRGVSPGGQIFIHGLPPRVNKIGKFFMRFGDWTAGCIALSNEDIEELWRVIPNHTPIEIQQ